MKTYTLFTTQWTPEYFEETKQVLFEANDYKSIADESVYDCISDQQKDQWDCLMEDTCIDNNGYGYILVGKLGLWNSTPTVAQWFKYADDAIKAANSRSIDDITITEDSRGHVYINAYHHDGCNQFELRKATKKGYEHTLNTYGGYQDNPVKCATIKSYTSNGCLMQSMGWTKNRRENE